MTQHDNLVNLIDKELEAIKNRLESYKKLDASLSSETLLLTAEKLMMADDILEKGFVKDSCEDIDKKLVN